MKAYKCLQLIKSILILFCILLFSKELLSQNIKTSKWSGGTVFISTFDRNETQRLANDWNYALITSARIINTMNNFTGGDVGVSIALRIAKTKVAWDLMSISRNYLNNGNFYGNWSYILKRSDYMSTPIVIADQIAAVWRDITGTVAAQIVGYAKNGLDNLDNIENAFLPGSEFQITYPYQNQKGWNFTIEGIGAFGDVMVNVYIKTDMEYFQGEAEILQNGRWRLNKSYPTLGQSNIIYAKMFKDGVLVAISNEIIIFP